jgi:threonine aldolase
MICDINSHVYQYEVGGYAFHSQIAVNPIPGNEGLLDDNLIRSHVKPKFDWLPRTKLVVIENSANRAGGNVYSSDLIDRISKCCRESDLRLHLDGARIFNALLATGIQPEWIGPRFDSLSICLSKGLGAPVGSVLIGGRDWIAECRRIRKAMGGGMRQVGILAAAGIYALDHHIERLSLDHDHAKTLAHKLSEKDWVEKILPVKTNIIIFDLKENIDPELFVRHMNTEGVHCMSFGKRSVRWVTHLDISTEMINRVCQILEKLDKKDLI